MAAVHPEPQARADPTGEELAEWARALILEIDDALSSDAWAIIDTGTDQHKHRLYDAAALRHCTALLAEIEAVASAGHELASRILIRTHIEAFLFALYIHFGGIEAVTKVAQDTLFLSYSDQKDFVEWKKEKKRARKARDSIRRNNEANARWNSTHPEGPLRPLFEEPYVPRLSPAAVDLSEAIASFGALEAKPLPVRTVINALTAWGPENEFGRESFTPTPKPRTPEGGPKRRP
jgi:hypothetical protein